MRALGGTLGILLACAIAAADDWPQFQGLRGNGASAERRLKRDWPEGGPAVLWRAKIKMGWSSPSVMKGEVFVAWTEERNGSAETVACLDAATGREKWKFTYDVGPYWKRNIGWGEGGFRSTPAVDAQHIFTLGAIGHLHCLDRATGKVIWSQNLWDEWFPSGEKGYNFSPILVGGRLVLWYGDGCHRVDDPAKKHVVLCRALDPDTGKILWTFCEPHLEPARMGEGQTPAIADFGGRKCVLFSGNCSLIALAVDDGTPVWRFECVRKDGRGTTMPTPLVLDRLIVNLPDQDVATAVSLDRSRPEAPASILWKRDLQTYTAVHQFRARDGFLYGFTGSIRGDSYQAASDSTLSFTCVDAATGRVKWSEPGFRNGVSLTEADGLLFVRSYQKLRLVEATPEGYRRKGEIETHECRRPVQNLVDLVMPVLSDGRLFVRTPDELICYAVSME